MAFDFPAAPAIGDKYTDATSGTEYVWTGTAWDLSSGGDLQDYVLKVGDTMTGPLTVQGDGTVGRVKLNNGNANAAGMVEFFKANGTTRMGYIGYGNDTYLRMLTDPGFKWDVQGQGFFMNEGAGIHWGQTPAQTDPLNFSEGICLYGYGTTSQFGFTITSGTLNYVVQNTGNAHVFRIGATEKLRVSGGGATVKGTLTIDNASTENFMRLSYGGGTPASQGALIEWMNADDSRKAYIGWGPPTELICQLDSATTFKIVGGNLNVSGNIYIRDNDILDLSNGYYIQKTSGSAQMFFHAGQNSGVFKFHITGFGDAYVIDKVGSVGNSVNVTAPDALAIAAELAVAPDPERGVDVMKVMAAMLAKIKLLEAELHTLKAKVK